MLQRDLQFASLNLMPLKVASIILLYAHVHLCVSLHALDPMWQPEVKLRAIRHFPPSFRQSISTV